MQPLHVFTTEEKEKIMQAKDMVTAAKELLAKKLGKRRVSADNVIFEVSRFDNVIKTVEDTQKVINWIGTVDDYVVELTNKQKPVAKYVREAVQEKMDILESSAADIVLKSYNGAKKNLTHAVEDLRAQREEYMKKGSHPDIIKLFDAALVYAIATEEAVDSSLNAPLSTISSYIKKEEEKQIDMKVRLTKEPVPEPMMVVHDAEVEEVEGDVIAAEIISAPVLPPLDVKEPPAPKREEIKKPPEPKKVGAPPPPVPKPVEDEQAVTPTIKKKPSGASTVTKMLSASAKAQAAIAAVLEEKEAVVEKEDPKAKKLHEEKQDEPKPIESTGNSMHMTKRSRKEE